MVGMSELASTLKTRFSMENDDDQQFDSDSGLPGLVLPTPANPSIKQGTIKTSKPDRDNCALK